MRATALILISLCLWGNSLTVAETAADAKPVAVIKKTLRHLLDTQGRHTQSPSLLDRDAYQAHLREHPEEVTGLRYELQIKYSSRPLAPLTIRVEIRHGKAADIQTTTHETKFEPAGRRRSQWARLTIEGEDFQALGDIIAWQVTLWDGESKVASDESFLW